MEWFKALWRRAPALPAREQRWVVVDCESSGLDPRIDRLLSVGAVRVEQGRIALASAFSVLLRQSVPSSNENIVVHGIAGGAQVSGTEGAQALRAFVEYAGGATLVAFHASFDRTLLGQAARSHGVQARFSWLDLAELAPALYPQHAARCKALDDWMAVFSIENTARHDALGDALATAQLFLVLLAEAERQGAITAQDLAAAAAGQRWLVR